MPEADTTENDSSLSSRQRTSTNNNDTSSSTSANTPTNNNASSGDTANRNIGGSNTWDIITDHISNHRIDFLLAVTRALTVLCTLSYIIGWPGPASNRYKQALLMCAATSSLRLHQRMPPPALNQISRAYFTSLIREDSFHYLIFPLMFFTGHPITMALLPCALYAMFNLAVYAIVILDKLGSSHEPLKEDIRNFVAKYQQSLLHTIALSEISLMAIVIVSLFMRVSGILLPFFYYRFLLLRYDSARNVHLKILVSQIKTLVTTYASRYMRR